MASAVVESVLGRGVLGLSAVRLPPSVSLPLTHSPTHPSYGWEAQALQASKITASKGRASSRPSSPPPPIRKWFGVVCHAKSGAVRGVVAGGSTTAVDGLSSSVAITQTRPVPPTSLR